MKPRARAFARRGSGASSMGMALGLGALLGGIGLIAAGARRREEDATTSGDSGDLDRELEALGVQRDTPRLEEDRGGIYRPVVETTAEEVPAAR